MTLADLSNWSDTKTALHQAMQALRSARLLGTPPLPVDLHYSAIPAPYGATTGPLSFGGELRLDYERGAVVYMRDGGEVFGVPLAGNNQTTLFDAVFAEMAAAGLDLEPNRGKVVETAPFKLDAEQAAAYADVQWRMYTVLARLKGRMLGPQSPIALWPHGFDLSTLWFALEIDEQSAHVNFGFSPGTPDIGGPYLYAYAWPELEGLEKQIPSIAVWHTAWSTPGCVIRYEKFAGESDPEAVAQAALETIYRAASGLMG